MYTPGVDGYSTASTTNSLKNIYCACGISLPHTQRWVSLLIDFAEAHVWEDTEIAGDIWNGRWKRQDIEDILGTDSTMIVSPEDFHLGIQWLTELTATTTSTTDTIYCSWIDNTSQG